VIYLRLARVGKIGPSTLRSFSVLTSLLAEIAGQVNQLVTLMCKNPWVR
jgi:hypothetical protein